MQLKLKLMKAAEPIYTSFFGHNNYQKFAIVGHARTGSNFLLSLLNYTDSIKAYNEIFGGHKRQKGEGYDLILSNTFKKERCYIKAVGFKVFYYHLTDNEWQKFSSIKDFKIIHLTRKNCLRTLVSLDLASKTQQWTSNAQKGFSPKGKSFLLDTSQLIERLERIQYHEAITRKRFEDRSILEITYEDLVDQPDKNLDSLSKFLGINDIRDNFPETSLKKQNPEKLEKLIANFDEVHHLLKDTKFASYLND